MVVRLACAGLVLGLIAVVMLARPGRQELGAQPPAPLPQGATPRPEAPPSSQTDDVALASPDDASPDDAGPDDAGPDDARPDPGAVAQSVGDDKVKAKPEAAATAATDDVSVPQTPAGSSEASRRTGEDWPEFLGPRRTGVSGETGLLKKWAEGGPPLAWKKKVGSGYTAPSIRGNRLVLFQRTRNEEVIEGLDADTGNSVWTYRYPTRFVDPYGYDNGPRCTPILTEDRCYTFGAEGRLVCVDLANGEKIWERDTANDFDVPEGFFGVGATPLLEGKLLITMVGGNPESGLVAFDADTGKTVWESVKLKTWKDPRWRYVKDAKLASYSTPIAATIHGHRLVFALMRPGLVAVDAATGEVRFSYFFRATFRDSVNAARPVVSGDMVFLSAAYDVGAALLKVHEDCRGYDEVWKDELAMQTHWSTCILHDRHLFGFSGRHEVGATFRCIDLLTGKLSWELQDVNANDIPSPKDGSGSTQPRFFGRGSKIMADGKFIILGERGLLALAEVNTKRYAEISRVQRPELDAPSWVAPVLSRQRLYLRDLDDLLCLDLKAR